MAHPITDESIDVLFELIHEHKLKCSLKAVWDDEVSKFGILIRPVKTYLEIPSYGPVPIKEIDYLLIDPVVKEKSGNSTNIKTLDKSSELSQALTNRAIDYEMVDGLFKITFSGC